jgi:hypothetical protein
MVVVSFTSVVVFTIVIMTVVAVFFMVTVVVVVRAHGAVQEVDRRLIRFKPYTARSSWSTIPP